MVTISTRDAERILLGLAGVADDRAASFVERLKQLRRLGVPSRIEKGRGRRNGRTLEQMLELALALRLLEAGIASSDVARLVREEWVLASSVLTILDWELTGRDDSPFSGAGVFWVAEPNGLSPYRSNADDRGPRLVTMILMDGFRLEDEIARWSGHRAWTAVVIPAKEVVLELLSAYVAAGVATMDDLFLAIRALRQQGNADLAKAVGRMEH